MLWVNLIMDTFAALALATEPPSESVLNREPVKTNEYIVNTDMWRNIMGQSVYQVIWLLIVLFLGDEIFGVQKGWEIDHWDSETGKHFTIFFNAFVFM